ncbi:MAG: DUF1580 domain-containing protein [Planctomycetales bacterium]|nr:DUF1580 domain-containing protein [Planctomycetales bacterium]
MIDIQNEQLLSLAEASREIPGGRVALSTLHRWRLAGIRGIRLETLKCGHRRITSREALERFFAATTAQSEGSIAAIESVDRQSAIALAENELERAGI